MLRDTLPVPSIAVKDLDAASDFYENTLGLSRMEGSDPTTIVYRSGSGGIMLYQSEYAGTNKATYASWAVGDDFDEVMDELRAKGVAFEHYDFDFPGASRDGDVHTMGDLRAAWFKDPDGNILNIVDQSQ